MAIENYDLVVPPMTRMATNLGGLLTKNKKGVNKKGVRFTYLPNSLRAG